MASMATQEEVNPRYDGKMIWLLVAYGCLAMLLVGYTTGIINGGLPPIIADLHLDSSQQSNVVSVTTLAAAFSCLAAAPLTSYFGRRPVLGVGSVLFTIGAITCAAARNFGVLFVGRLVGGVAIGFASVTAPMLQGEIAPDDIRGLILVLNTLCIVLGQASSSTP